MEKKAHAETHKRLHDNLDELVADWIMNTEKRPSTTTVLELMKWSANQIPEPDHKCV